MHEPANGAQVFEDFNQSHDVSVAVVGEQGGTGGLHEVATPANDFGIGLRFFDFANHDRGVLIATGFPGKEKELFRHQKWGLESFGDAYQSDGGHDHGANHPAACPENVFILFHQ